MREYEVFRIYGRDAYLSNLSSLSSWVRITLIGQTLRDSMLTKLKEKASIWWWLLCININPICVFSKEEKQRMKEEQYFLDLCKGGGKSEGIPIEIVFFLLLLALST